MRRSQLISATTAQPRRIVSAVAGAAAGMASAGLRAAARLVELGAGHVVVSGRTPGHDRRARPHRG